ncbi:MAG: DNA translocase FtsK [Clostridia bacterium]|nr:DNA translocase FtsK [Clostridia bacterium]
MATKRGKKKKKSSKVDINIAVVVLVLLSILLMILIYTKSGSVGAKLSPMLGGIMGFIKYVIPIGMLLIAISMTRNDRYYMTHKLTQYGIFLVCIAAMLSIFQGNINVNRDFSDIMQDCYYNGERDVGGGVIGGAVAVPLIKMLGTVGAAILTIGISILLLVFIFNIKPAEIIANFLDGADERKAEREAYEEERLARREKVAKSRKLPQIDLDDDEPPKETKKEKRLREKAEAEKLAAQFEDQLTINLNDEEDKLGQKYDHTNDELDIPFFGKKKLKGGQEAVIEEPKPEPSSPDVLEANLFKQVEEQKEDKTKEILQLEHTVTVEDENYEFPPVQLLSEPEKKTNRGSKKSVADTATQLQKTLYSFGVSAKVEDVSVGPAITRYELKPAEGVRVSKIANLADDIALNLAAESIRIEAPIPGKQAVGIEIPNKENEMVHFREIIEDDKFVDHKSKLAFGLGKDVAGQAVVTDIAKMPHVLIAGATGSGKSVCINTLISSILYKAKPSEAKLLMVDPKIVELSVYNGIPHLLIPVVTDPKKAAGALAWAVQEMEDRYQRFATKGVRDLKGYNEAMQKEEGNMALPQIVIIIDELADLMMVSPKDVEDSICRLAQKARAAGMHLVIATQRPSVDVITGIIKANIPSRIAFSVSSQVDSRTILDMAGAEKLLGKGDMLFYPAGASKPTRVQGAFVSDSEVEKIVDFIKAEGEVTYNEDIIEQIENSNKTDKEKDLESEQADDDGTDPFLMEAIDTVVETKQASTSFIQRRFKVGYARAGRIIDQMEERGVISGYQGSKPREVLMSKERWQELKMAQNAPAENSEGVQD